MTLFDEIQQMIDESMSMKMPASMEAYADMHQTASEVILTVELPGVKKDDIEVEATEDSISVSAESKRKKETKKKGMYKAGSRYFEFSSTYATPAEIRPETVEAEYANGVLEVRAKKAKVEKKKSKKVKVR